MIVLNPYLGDWLPYFKILIQQNSVQSLMLFLNNEIKQNHTVLPDHKNWLKAFEITGFRQTKIVIIGQDPYLNKNQADGLCFSVPDNISPPASLANIFKAIEYDFKQIPNQAGDLTRWAKQGVLLLNSILTLRQGQTGSHKHQGWEYLTNSIIKTISDKKQAVVFLLWGKQAQKKITLVDQSKHLVLTTSHPSPLSAYRGFLTCQHFSQSNAYLLQHQLKPINWL